MGPEITNEDSFNEPRKRVKNLRIYCDSKVIPSHKCKILNKSSIFNHNFCWTTLSLARISSSFPCLMVVQDPS